MKTRKFLPILAFPVLTAAFPGLAPARAEAPPVLPGIVLDKGEIGTRLDFDFVSGRKIFDQDGKGRSAPGGFQFSESKSTVDLSYGLTGSLTLGLSLPVIHREYSGFYVFEDQYDLKHYCNGVTTTTTIDNTFYIPYGLRNTGIGDVTLEARYRPFRLPGYLPDLAARLAGKFPVGSNGINFDSGKINLGDGQSDIYFGITGQGTAPFLLYDFSLDYRLRFSGAYDYRENRQAFDFNHDPGDEFRARLGVYLAYQQLTLGLSGNYINIGKSRTWLEDVVEDRLGAGYYFQLTPALGLKTSPKSSFSFSVEVPLAGKNYPVDSPNSLYYNLFDYRWSLSFQCRI